MSLSDDDIRILFDAAINSLDFGSGFLDNEEVEALRRVAVYLGVDPVEATPRNFIATYYPKYPKLTLQEAAAKAGHIGVEYKETPDGWRYSCKCGWFGPQAHFDAHLVEMGVRLQSS